jgi:hypothetical protein
MRFDYMAGSELYGMGNGVGVSDAENEQKYASDAEDDVASDNFSSTQCMLSDINRSFALLVQVRSKVGRKYAEIIKSLDEESIENAEQYSLDMSKYQEEREKRISLNAQLQARFDAKLRKWEQECERIKENNEKNIFISKLKIFSPNVFPPKPTAVLLPLPTQPVMPATLQYPDLKELETEQLALVLPSDIEKIERVTAPQCLFNENNESQLGMVVAELEERQIELDGQVLEEKMFEHFQNLFVDNLSDYKQMREKETWLFFGNRTQIQTRSRFIKDICDAIKDNDVEKQLSMLRESEIRRFKGYFSHRLYDLLLAQRHQLAKNPITRLRVMEQKNREFDRLSLNM